MKVKVKVPPKQGVQAQSGSRGIPVALLIHNFHARLGQVVNAMLQFLTPRKEPRCMLYRKLGRPQQWTGVERRACFALIRV